MFYVLSKTVNFLAMPLTIVCICLLLAIFLRNPRWKKAMLITGVILLVFFSNSFIANQCMRAWEIDPAPYANMAPYEMGIILTGTTMLFAEPHDRIFFKHGADRMTHSVQLYQKGLIKRIIISGGSGGLVPDNHEEAVKMKKTMVIMGVPADSIFVEITSRNTHESAVAVRPLLDSLDLTANDCLLITSAFHMRRSQACFRKVGLELTPFPCDFYSQPQFINLSVLLVPDVDAIVIWHKLVKEWIGLLAYKLVGYV